MVLVCGLGLAWVLTHRPPTPPPVPAPPATVTAPAVPGTTPENPAATPANPAAPTAAPVAAQETAQTDYRLVPNDLLDFRVFQEPDLDAVIRQLKQADANVVVAVPIPSPETPESTT